MSTTQKPSASTPGAEMAAAAATTPLTTEAGTNQQSGTSVAATHVSTTPVETKKAKTPKTPKIAVKDEEHEDLQHTPFKRGDAAVLDLGVSGIKVPGTISGVYSDDDGLHYELSVQTEDAQPLRGLKAKHVKLTVSAAVVVAPEVEAEAKAKKSN